MNSLATLSEEKSRMEASFQADKRQLRSDKEEVSHKIGSYHFLLKYFSCIDYLIIALNTFFYKFKTETALEKHYLTFLCL